MLVPHGFEPDLRQRNPAAGRRHRDDRPGTRQPPNPRRTPLVVIMTPHTTRPLILTHSDAANSIPSAAQHTRQTAGIDTAMHRFRIWARLRGRKLPGMDDTTNSATNRLAWAWEKQSVWSQTATSSNRPLFRARKTSLWLTILAAVLATVAVQIGSLSDLAARILAAVAALAMGLVALLQKATTRDRVQDWTRARSVSEALKAGLHVLGGGGTVSRCGSGGPTPAER